MKNNEELQSDVQKAIKWEPLLHAAEIGVTAKNGVVTLTGEVDSYIKKMEAEHAVKRVTGVKALIENIEVKLPSRLKKTDTEVVSEVLKALKDSWSVPSEKVTVKVEKGCVTLGGELPWNYQREDATNAIHFLSGVSGVKNHIKIKSDSFNEIEEKEVENAIKRSAIDGSNIRVKANGTTVTLSGKVNSWYQKEEAERIAWKTKGIWNVDNQIELDYYFNTFGNQPN